MIGALTGALAFFEPSGDHAVEVELDVQGVGYRVLLGARDAATLPPLGTTMSLSVHTHVRETEFTLYGFADRGARRAFELLINAHGVGPALALAMLSVHTPSSLARAVSEGDLDQLCLVPGIGRKTAQRLAIELSSRLDQLAPSFTPSLGTVDGVGRGEVREALLALGYRSEEIRAVHFVISRKFATGSKVGG